MFFMFGDDWNDENFEETVRSIAREAGRSLERLIDGIDLDERADAIGVDPATAREWVQSAGSWLRSRAEGLGEEVAGRVAKTSGPATSPDMFLGAVPHPLDVPTEEQGLALAALNSRRWAVEPGTETLSVKGDGPSPSDELGIVRELLVRDWITADGNVTLVGQNALTRWVQTATR